MSRPPLRSAAPPAARAPGSSSYSRAATDPSSPRTTAPTQRVHIGNLHSPPVAKTTAASGERPPVLSAADTAIPMTSRDSASQRFQRALASGNPRLVRAAAAELPHIGLSEAAAILLVIERTEPENYERTALRWLARLATEAPLADLLTVAHVAAALNALPYRPAARADLAKACRQADLPDVAAIFAIDDHRRSPPSP